MSGSPAPVADRFPDGVLDLVAPYLGQQRWFSGEEAPRIDDLRIVSAQEIWSAPEGDRRMWHGIIDTGGALYQVLIGERRAGDRADFLHGHEEAVLGSVGDSYFYDATLDAEMARALLEVASDGGETARRARPVTAEQSNTSIVFDDRLILKVFRRLEQGRNLDVEVTTALAEAKFEHVARPLVTWRTDDYDLAFGQQFLSGGTEGWALALTSLRDLLNSESVHPGESGGDFAAEAERLGHMTAEMHIALAEGFGRSDRGAARAAWSALVASVAERLPAASDAAGVDLVTSAEPLVDHLRSIDDPGPVLRTHGDYHLGQVMRTDSGWYVLDFEGEPARPLSERIAPASPLKDVTGMLRSLDYAARRALSERLPEEQGALAARAEAWEAHNRQAFLEGYRGAPAIGDLLPDPSTAAAVLLAYELDKALYEYGYERDHRPEWVSIPLDAMVRLIVGGADAQG